MARSASLTLAHCPALLPLLRRQLPCSHCRVSWTRTAYLLPVLWFTGFKLGSILSGVAQVQGTHENNAQPVFHPHENFLLSQTLCSCLPQSGEAACSLLCSPLLISVHWCFQHLAPNKSFWNKMSPCMMRTKTGLMHFLQYSTPMWQLSWHGSLHILSPILSQVSQ